MGKIYNILKNKFRFFLICIILKVSDKPNFTFYINRKYYRNDKNGKYH